MSATPRTQAEHQGGWHPVSGTVASQTGTCEDCGKDIRQNKAGVWGARRRDDPHPWYCDATGDRHQPAARS
jgi:hypothetical protein